MEAGIRQRSRPARTIWRAQSPGTAPGRRSQLGLVTTIALSLWEHPFLTLTFALLVLALLIAMVRLIWRTLRQVFAGRWVPRHGFLQDARTSDRLGRREDDHE